MYTIEKYNNDITLLAKSLVIKHHNIGLVMERHIAAGKPISTDYKTWKYYLNMAGIKHPTNNDVQVLVIETNTMQSLTAQVLIDNPATRSDLDLRLDSYNALLEAYPDDHLYINGCVNPVPVDVSTTALDGDIITYAAAYVEPQEISIIRELSDLIKGFLHRWYIVDYNITDELYMASVWGVLLTAVPGMIAGLRNRSANTSEAHSFHLEHFFRSHLDIWAAVSSLPKREQWWLYRNLVWLMNNSGTRDAFDTLVTNVLTPAGIGVGLYELSISSSKHTKTPAVNLPNFIRGVTEFKRVGINKIYRSPTPVINIPDTVGKELSVATNKLLPDTITLDTLTAIETTALDTVAQIRQPSKIIDFGVVELFNNHSKSPLLTILDNWLVDSHTGKYVLNTTFQDTSNNKTYRLNAKTGVLLFYYLMYTRLGITNPTLGVVISNDILKQTIAPGVLLSGTLGGSGRQYVVNAISKLPSTGVIRTAPAYRDKLDSIFTYYGSVWELDSNVDNTFLSADIKHMVSKVYQPTSIVVSPTSTPIRDILNANGIVVDATSGYDTMKVMADLLLAFTGHHIDEAIVIRETYNNYKTMLDRLTSHTEQVVTPDVIDSAMGSPYTTLSVNKPAIGYLAVTAGSIDKILEDNNGVMTAAGNTQILNPQLVGRQTTPTGIHTAAKNVKVTASCRYSGGAAGVVRSTVIAELLHPGYNKFFPQVIGSGNQIVGNQVINAGSSMRNSVRPGNPNTGANINANVTATPTAGVTMPAASVQIPTPGVTHYQTGSAGSSANNVTGNTPTVTTTPPAQPAATTSPSAPTTAAKATNNNASPTKPTTTTTIK